MSVLEPSRAPSRSPSDATPSEDPSPSWPSWAQTALVVVVALSVAFGLVFRFVTQSPLWLDEALTVNIARLPVGDIGEALRHDGHPPLFYYLLHGWMAVFGEGDVAVRALPGIISVATLPLVWVAGRRLGGRDLALMALLVLVLSPYAFRYATEARMYSLVIFGVLAAYLLVQDALEQPHPLRLVGVAVLSGLLLLTHYWSFWLLGATLLVLARRWWSRRDGATARVAIAVAAGGLLFLPWLPSFLYQATHTGTPWAEAVRPGSALAQTVDDFAGGDYQEALLFGMILFALFAVGLLGRTIDDRHIDLDLHTAVQVRLEAAMVGLTLTLGIVAGFVTGSTFASRYASVFFIFFVLVVAAGLTRFIGLVPRATVVGLVVLFGVIGAGANVTMARSQAGVISDAVNRDAEAGDLVVICPDQLGPALHRRLRADLAQVIYPTFEDPEFVDWVDYADRNAAADPAAFAERVLDEAGEGRIWLAWSGSYRTLEGQCESVIRVLRSTRPRGGTVVSADGDEFYEHATLQTFEAS